MAPPIRRSGPGPSSWCGRSGRSNAPVARALGGNPEPLRRWVQQIEIDPGQRDGLTTAEQAELARLRRAVAVLKEAREIRKQAAALFARARATRCAATGASRPTWPSPRWRAPVGCSAAQARAPTPGAGGGGVRPGPGRRPAGRAHRGHAAGKPRSLWQSARARRAASDRGAVRAPPGRPADAPGGAARLPRAAPPGADDDAGSAGDPGPRSGGTRLHAQPHRCARSALGGREQRRLDPGRLAVSRRHPRCLPSTRGGLGHGRSPPDGAGP